MDPVKSRRDEYSEATRRALLDSATTLFTQRGYAGTSLDDVARAARLTKGALYHHYENKRALFEAIVAEQEERAAQATVAAIADTDDRWEAAMAGVEAYLDYCLDDTYRRLVLEEAPVVLGWTWSRDCESMVMMRVTEVTLGALMADGIIVEQPLDMLTRVAHGTIGQLAFSILESEDRAQARIDAGRLIRRLFEALRPETVPAPPRQGARSRRRSG